MARTTKARLAETDLGAALTAHLQSWGWDCYPEAQVRHHSRRPDIAAVREGKLLIVELKTQLSFELISQAMGWLQTAHFVAIGIPATKGFRTRDPERDRFVRAFLSQHGIGIFTIKPSRYKYEAAHVAEDLSPKMHRWAHPFAKKFMAGLREDMKSNEAGAARGGHITEFKRTIQSLEFFVGRNPGCTLKAAIEGIPHHYASVSSARGALTKLIHLAKVRVVHEGRQLRLYPPSPDGSAATIPA